MPLTFDNETVERFAKHLGKAKNIALIAHKNPDGDAVGSMLGFYHWLYESFFVGEEEPRITMVLPHPIPEDASYLPDSDKIINAVAEPARCKKALLDADLIMGVDFNNASRVEPLDEALEQSQAVKLLCDHHHNPDRELFDEVISVADLSSTCELIFWLFVQIIGESSITLNTARCLYHGINTDTGCFSYSNEDPSLYEAVAVLMRHPLHAAEVHNRLFNNYSCRKMNILRFLLGQRMKIFADEGFAYLYINAADLAKLEGTAEDLEGLVNYSLMMRDVDVGVMVKETDGQVRMSFRSKSDFDVNRFANKYFGGGGHTKASGATSQYDFDTTLKILEERMLEELRENREKKLKG